MSIQDRYADSPAMSKLLALITGIGFVFSAWLTSLELFVIHAICQWCVISAIIVTSCFVVALLDLTQRRAGLRNSHCVLRITGFYPQPAVSLLQSSPLS